MRYGTFFSGIGAESVAWAPLGWKLAFHSEIDKFANAVLEARFPDTPNLGDIRSPDFIKRAKECGTISLLAAGSPCQSFSVAGLRKSLSDSRGNLTLRFVEVAHGLEPTWIVWENVPGVLNTKDNAFGCFLAGLSGADAPLRSHLQGGAWPSAGVVDGPWYGLAWRIADSKFFGVPQRRRRVFLVGYLRDWHPAAKILFEPGGMQRYPAEGEEEREGTPKDVAACLNSGGNQGGFRTEPGEHIIPIQEIGKRTGSGGEGQHGCGIGEEGDPMFTLQAGAQHGLAFGSKPNSEIAKPLKAGNDKQDESYENYVVHPLRGEGFDASEDETGRGTPIIPFDTTQITSPENRSNPKSGDPSHPLASGAHPPCIAFGAKDSGQDAGENSPTLRAGGHKDSHPNAGVPPAVVYDIRGHTDGKNSPTLSSDHPSRPSDKAPCVTSDMTVRRLTPRECERLMGFPDDFTQIPWRGKPASECPDGPRYKALGNSMVTHCVRWIGERIQKYEKAK